MKKRIVFAFSLALAQYASAAGDQQQQQQQRGPRVLGQDFAPLTVYRADDTRAPLSQHGLAVGWYIKGGATVDGQPLDYARAKTDEAYAERALEQNDDAFSTRVHNLIYSLETNKSITDVPRPNDYAACYNMAVGNSNHRGCDFDYEPGSGFIVFQVNLKWTNGSIQAIKLVNGRAVAWGDLTDKVPDLMKAPLDQKYRNNAAYQESKRNNKLGYSFTINSIEAARSPGDAVVKGVGSVATIHPGGDEAYFEGSIQGKVKLVYDGTEAVQIESLK